MRSRVIDDRATKLGEYIVENKATVRRAAKQFGVSNQEGGVDFYFDLDCGS